MANLVSQLRRDFPSVSFSEGQTFFWSPKKSTVIYTKAVTEMPVGQWSLLHELGHALLSHDTYESDFNLLDLEIEAWEMAKKTAQKYGLTVDEEHIQNCLDTYRDWLYQRSTCPICTATGLQTDKHTYVCLNCDGSWRVSNSRLCRPYRLKQKALA